MIEAQTNVSCILLFKEYITYEYELEFIRKFAFIKHKFDFFLKVYECKHLKIRDDFNLL